MYKEFFMMRLSAIAVSAALATAACSTGPDDEQKAAAQSEFQSCMGIGKANGVMSRYAPTLTDVTAKLDGLDAEKITAQKYPNFSVRGTLPTYEEKFKDGKTTTTAKMDVGITLKSLGGEFSATLAGSKFTTDSEGKTRNYPLYSETLAPKTSNYKDIKVDVILTEAQGCAIVAQQKLGL
jgi:hypothetical protein